MIRPTTAHGSRGSRSLGLHFVLGAALTTAVSVAPNAIGQPASPSLEAPPAATEPEKPVLAPAGSDNPEAPATPAASVVDPPNPTPTTTIAAPDSPDAVTDAGRETATASDEAGRCSAGQVRAASDLARGALARVEAPGIRGLGVAIDGSGHLLTALSIVEVGRGIKVRFGTDESWRDGSVVAVDEEHGLAIVQVEGGAPGAWVPVPCRDAEVGDSVVTLTLSTRFDGYNFEQDFVAQPGRVTASEVGRLRSDAFGGEHHQIGAPLLDCNGQLVGVGTESHEDRSASTGAIRSLIAGMSDQEPYDGNWSFAHPSIAFGAQLGHSWSPGFGEPDRWFGVRIGTALIGNDQWFFPVRMGLYGLAGPEPDSPLADRSGLRFQAETGFGYRAMLKGGAMPVYLVPQATAVLSWERTTLEGTALSVNLGDCDAGGECPVKSEPVTVEDDLLRVMPAVGVVLGMGRGELGYQFQIDVEEIARSVHSLTAGFQF